jgi:hypothetical protein
MSRDIIVQARWDGEAGVWIATSPDVSGLVVEADTWPAMIEEVRIVLPELLEVSGAPAGKEWRAIALLHGDHQAGR